MDKLNPLPATQNLLKKVEANPKMRAAIKAALKAMKERGKANG